MHGVRQALASVFLPYTPDPTTSAIPDQSTFLFHGGTTFLLPGPTASPSTGAAAPSFSSPSTPSRTMTFTSSSSMGTPSTTFTSSIVPPKTSAGSLSLTSGVQTSFAEKMTSIGYSPAMTALPTLSQASSTSAATALPVTALSVTTLPTTALSASPTSSTSSSSRSTLSTRDIIIVIASVAGLFLVAILIFYALRHRTKKPKYEAPTIAPYAFAQPSAQVHSVKQGLHMGTSPLADSHSDVYSLSSQTFLTSGNEWEASDESTGTLTRIASSARERLLSKIRSLVRREVAKNKHSVRSNSIAE